MDKKQIRKIISEKKKSMSLEEIERLSAELTKRFLSLQEYEQAECLFAYISYNQEVRTRMLIEKALADGKRVAVPKVIGDDMEFRYIISEADLVPGYKGIKEPSESTIKADGKERKVLMLMPGLAFDRMGNRIGYGKGYYDRYLYEHSNIYFQKIALCYDFQVLDLIEAEQYDRKVDRLIAAGQKGVWDEINRN